MTNLNIKVLGVELSYEVPTSVEEFDELAKRQGACLEMAVKQEIYHGSMGSIRDRALEIAFEAAKGVNPDLTMDNVRKTEREQPTEEGKVGKLVKHHRTPAKALDWLVAEEFITEEQKVEAIRQATTECPFDPSVTERKSAKVPKTYLGIAQKIADKGQLEAVAEQLGAELGYAIDVSDTDTAVENLGRAIWSNEKKENARKDEKYIAAANQG